MPYKDKEKQKKYQQQWYIDNQKPTIAQRSKDQRKKAWEWINSIKHNVPCYDCGNNFPTYCMDYHHVDKKNKSFTISSALTSKGKGSILKEIEKCILICANCHRIREYGE